jgi:DNA-binding XRE family transcriptional regulator
MRVRATVRIRNDEMLRAREALGWSQTECATAAGASLRTVMRLEALDCRMDIALAVPVAATLGLALDKVYPMALAGKRPVTTMSVSQEVPEGRLLGLSAARALPAPEEGDGMMATRVDEALGKLSATSAAMIRMRFGIGQDPMTLGEIGGLCGVGGAAIAPKIHRIMRKMRKTGVLDEFKCLGRPAPPGRPSIYRVLARDKAGATQPG